MDEAPPGRISLAVAGVRERVTRDEGSLRRAVWLLLGAGLVLRLGLAATTPGSIGDLLAFRFVDRALGENGLSFYSQVNAEEGRFAWPYLTGFLPILEALFAFANATGIAFERVIRLPAIGADLAIAWVVQWHLGWRGASREARAGAVALIALGPVGVAFTGAHGQIDPLEWLPVVLAVVAWERLPVERRAVVAGLLVGLGLSFKPPAALAGLAFFALSSGMRERLTFTAAASVIPGLAFLPFLVADPDGALSIFAYQSVPGQGGLSMILQPDLALARFGGLKGVDSFTAASQLLQDVAPLLVGAAALGVAVVGARSKVDPATLIAALILAVLVVSPNFLPPYLIWIVPFAVLAGWWRFVLVLYAFALVLLPFKYLPPRLVDLFHVGDARGIFHLDLVSAVYVPAGAFLWAVMAWQVGSWAARARRTAS